MPMGNVPAYANIFALYAEMRGWQLAERRLATAIAAEAVAVRCESRTIQQAYKRVMRVAKKYQRYGAYDTASRECIAAKLEQEAFRKQGSIEQLDY